MKEKDRFTHSGDSWEYADLERQNSQEAPFEKEEQAVDAAKAFVVEHFGTLEDPLVTTRVVQGSHGGGAVGDRTPPRKDGHTVCLLTRHDGFLIEGSYAVIYLAGRTVWSASVRLLSVKPIDGTEHALISQSEAIRIWTEGVEKTFEIRSPKYESVDIHYVWSPPDFRNQPADRSQGQILRPNWVFGSGADLLVDAFTGALWRND